MVALLLLSPPLNQIVSWHLINEINSLILEMKEHDKAYRTVECPCDCCTCILIAYRVPPAFGALSGQARSLASSASDVVSLCQRDLTALAWICICTSDTKHLHLPNYFPALLTLTLDPNIHFVHQSYSISHPPNTRLPRTKETTLSTCSKVGYRPTAYLLPSTTATRQLLKEPTTQDHLPFPERYNIS